MFHQSIAVPAAPPADQDIGRDLTLLAANLDTRFLHAGTMLATAIGMVDRIIAGLDTIAETLDETHAGAAAADLARVARRIGGLPAMLVARRTRMKAIGGIAGEMRGHILDMHRALRVLGIYGMNIKIAASGEAQFIGFVDGMNTKLAYGEDLLLQIIARLKDLDAGLAGGRQADQLLEAECRDVVPMVPERLATDAMHLDRHLSRVAGVARRVAVIARSIQGKVAVLLGALQIGDSVRQRLEHVVAALQIVEAQGCGPAAAAHVDRLLAAQLDATVEDFARETATLISSLKALDPDVRALRTLIAEQAGEEGRGVLSRLNDSVTDIDRTVVQVQSADRQASAMTDLVAATVTTLTRQVGNLNVIRRDVQDIATNTRLICRRYGNVGRAVSVVATEIETHARDLGRSTDAVSGTIDRLQDAGNASQDEPAQFDITQLLGAALDVIRQACHRTEQVVMAGGDDAENLLGLIRTTAAEMTGELALSDTMHRAAAALSVRAALQPVDPEADDTLVAAMAAIARTYSMAQEREVHRHFLPPGMAEAAPVPAAVDDGGDDDDGLF